MSVKHSAFVVLTLACNLFLSFPVFAQDASWIRYSGPELLTFGELCRLSDHPVPSGPLALKLSKIFRVPFISNENYFKNPRLSFQSYPGLGPLIRLAAWDLNKSLNLNGAVAAFHDTNQYVSMIDPQAAPPDSIARSIAIQQQLLLQMSDILVLQEMDMGMKRSGYVNTAKQMAESLHMNYAFGVSFVEVDPIYLGREMMVDENGMPVSGVNEYFAADPKRYLGLTGSAVLSRFPIKQVILFPLITQAYDWYYREAEQPNFFHKRIPEEGVRYDYEPHREMKIGGRTFMRVDVHVPGLPNDTLTIVNVHLEERCFPAAREAQIREILGYIRTINNPVVMAGNFNTAPDDLQLVSFGDKLIEKSTNPATWVGFIATQMSPHAAVINSVKTGRSITNATKNFQNPAAPDVPLLAPNIMKGLFDAIEQFRFNDGFVFDFRGDVFRSANGISGLLSNSNERDDYGFKMTFRFLDSFGFTGPKHRLDWVFVKSFLQPTAMTQPANRLAPHYGRTFEVLNTVLLEPVSNHHPNLVDLPLREPQYLLPLSNDSAVHSVNE